MGHVGIWGSPFNAGYHGQGAVIYNQGIIFGCSPYMRGRISYITSLVDVCPGEVKELRVGTVSGLDHIAKVRISKALAT